jgi:hypothetical protein
MRRGKNASGQLVDDPTINQAFMSVEKDISDVHLRLTIHEEYKVFLAKQVETALEGLSSTAPSSNADIVTALQDMATRIKKL